MPSFETKDPRNLTDDDVAEIKGALTGIRIGVLRPWTDHLLTFLSPEDAVEAMRHAPAGLWPQLAAEIALSGELVVQDEPRVQEYLHLIEEWEASGDFYSKEQDYIATHLGPPYVSSLGRMFVAMTQEERTKAIESCDLQSSGLITHIVNFLRTYHPSLLLPLLPAIEGRAGRTGYVVVEELLKAAIPECHDAALRITLGMTDSFARFLAFRALHAASPERHFAETFSSALESMAGPEDNNNHHVVAEWLCRYAGEEGIAEVVRYLKTRDTMWLSSVAHFSIRELGNRATPIIEVAKEIGILEADATA